MYLNIFTKHQQKAFPYSWQHHLKYSPSYFRDISMKIPLKNGFRGGEHGPFPLLIPSGWFYFFISPLPLVVVQSGNLQPTEAAQVVQLLRARCVARRSAVVSQHSVENVEETPGDVEVAVGGQRLRGRTAICSFVQDGGWGLPARAAEDDLHQAVRVQDSACHQQTPRGWDHWALVMDVKDAVGNILLLATLLWWVNDGLGRDYTDLHMLAPDLISPLWFWESFWMQSWMS